MALVFLPLNGIGLGHVSRSFTLALELQELGESPVIFSQGIYPKFMASRVPGLKVGTIYKASYAERARIAQEVQVFARRTMPAVVLEDTHPAPLQLADDIHRILIVRPTTFDYMRKLREVHLRSYRKILVADHPASPSWPFENRETEELSSWPNWRFLGPVFRLPRQDGRPSIRRKYAIKDHEPLFVVSLGGGGLQQMNVRDLPFFMERASAFASEIRRATPRARFLLVWGHLFPADAAVAADFETVAIEDDLPSLLAEAQGALIRPGFNTTWECIGAGTPFLPIVGTAYKEPVADRLARMLSAGLVAGDVGQLLDEGWKSAFRECCQSLVERWPAKAAASVLYSAIYESVDLHPADNPAKPPDAAWKPSFGDRCLSLLERWSPLGTTKALPRASTQCESSRLEVSRPTPADIGITDSILIRIDDVTEATGLLTLLVRMCEERGFALSLEVVPYLCRLSEEHLLELFGPRLVYEVGQHGYAHIPRRLPNGRKTEFLPEEACSAPLRDGMKVMRARFPTRFAGGFSAPYDFLPSWLPDRWQQTGGKYLTVVTSAPPLGPLPVVRLGADPWDWSRKGPSRIEKVLRVIEQQLAETRVGGLVFHPQLLAAPGEIRRMEYLLDRILQFGCRPRLCSEVALSEQNAPWPS